MKNNESDIREYKFYRNPIARNGDFADPFILKYNGRYYLYCTNPDVKCWSSINLLDWKYEGTVIAPGQLEGLVPFAPEVVYWNGYFYMYTSPSGLGHYILKSENPTGPFTLQTGNIGLTIDGSVFIDDDGKWFFYRAGDTGIKGHVMKDPVTIACKETDINASMDGWTEGPFLVKKNGKYYLTYTGNNYLSAGYRVNYSVSGESPLTGFKPYSKNPFLLNTEGKGIGLGHSMSFFGPDLDAWYIAYHNINPDATRDLNIDRLAWNGDKMVVYGPTVTKQVAPEMPDFYDYFERNELGNNWIVMSGRCNLENGFLRICDGNGENGLVLLKNLDAMDYTVEFNMKLSEGRAQSEARFGGVISYYDKKNYGLILLNPLESTIETQIIANGKIKGSKAALPDGYDCCKLHCIRAVKFGDELNVYVDNMLKLTTSVCGLKRGNIGFYSETSSIFGYFAVSGKTNGESIFSAFKPIPGNIEAIHFSSYVKIAGHNLKPESKRGASLCRGYFTEQCGEGGFSVALRERGEWLAYNVNIKETALYNMDLRVTDVQSETELNILLDDVNIVEHAELAEADGEFWRTQSIKGLNLQEGLHELKIELAKGSLKLYTIGFYKAGNRISRFREEFDRSCGRWAYSSGIAPERHEGGELLLGPYGKLLTGEDGWSDYSVEVDVKGDTGLNSGIIFRVANPAEGGGDGKDCKLGANFYQGYFAGLTHDGVILLKQNYDRRVLAKAQGNFEPGKSYHLKIEVKGDNIKVYADEMKKPSIDYTDNDPFTHGKAGIRTEGETAYFANFVVIAV